MRAKAALEGSSGVEARRRWRTKDRAEELNRGKVGKTERERKRRGGGTEPCPPAGRLNSGLFTAAGGKNQL